MGRIIKNNVLYASTNASDITYSNPLLVSTNVQDAIDELGDKGRSRHIIYQDKILETFTSPDDVTNFVEKHKIAEGEFCGLEVGNKVIIDYGNTFETNVWIIVGFDIDYGKGSNDAYRINKHHIALIPDGILDTYTMNPNTSTDYCYFDTQIHKIHLNHLLPGYTNVYKAIKDVVGENHMLPRCLYLTNGYIDYTTKKEHTGGWYYQHSIVSISSYFSLLTELQVTGTALTGDNADAGESNTILPYFAMLGRSNDLANKKKSNGGNFTTKNYWLRNSILGRTGSDTPQYAYINDKGNISRADYNTTLGVRPMFCLC